MTVTNAHLVDGVDTLMTTSVSSQDFADEAPESRQSTRSMRILLAEDNVVNQKVAIRQLQKLGYRADAVADGHEVLEALERIPYDLVLMDCQMPEMDGYEAAAEIRRREGDGRHTPIVALTAHALEGDRAKCIAAGMDDYISKPVRPEELARVLDRLLRETGNDSPVSTDQPASVNDALPVDMDRLRISLGDDPEERAEFLGLYLEQMSTSLENLRDVIASGNCREVHRIAHNCAGVSATCGMATVADLFRRLDRKGSDEDLTGAEDLRQQICAEFERIRLFVSENVLCGV
jgi:CheY-like chemotaxis protein/HPt (histidine-containing phosphotransfer) domain-containing protein